MAKDKRLYQGIQEKMLQRIITGEYPVGGRLPPERELAEAFGVSRPTIREAIIALEALGRVRVKTGSGVYVQKHMATNGSIDTSVSAFELTEARAVIEGEAAALAATMISDEQITELEAALEAMGDESGDDNEAISETADKNFHRVISQATSNSMLISVIDNLWHVRDHSPDVHRSYQAICETDGSARVNEHREILEALKNRDPNAARKAMHEHFSRILNKLITVNEAEQVDEARRRALESRERFSLNHLVTNT